MSRLRMKVRRAHKIALEPTGPQRQQFVRAAGCARFAWNWALAEWKRQFKAGGKPTANALKRQFNAVKGEQFPWLYESPKDANLQPFAHLNEAFQRFFKKLAKSPAFKKKGRCKDAFYVSNDKFSLDGKRVRLPRIGWVKMREALRFEGKVLGATVSRTADRWFLAVQVETELFPLQQVPSTIAQEGRPSGSETQACVVGVDLGIKHLAVLSDGQVFDNPKPLRRALRKLRRLNRRLHRKLKGSANRRKAAGRVSRLHARMTNVRQDTLHKLTALLSRNYGHVVIEDPVSSTGQALNVSGMLRKRRLARAIADVGLHEFRRQLTYKAEVDGTLVTVVDRWYASSKTCSGCGTVKEILALSQRDYVCMACGLVKDRDWNAACNLERYPGLRGNPTPPEQGRRGTRGRWPSRHGSVKLRWTKQEFMRSNLRACASN